MSHTASDAENPSRVGSADRPSTSPSAEREDQAEPGPSAWSSIASYSTLRAQASEGVLVVTLDRPERMNAFTLEMADELVSVIDRADRDDAVRAVVLTGAGKAFCAGADLEGGGSTFETEEVGEGAIDRHRDAGGVVTLRFYESRKPLIAAINGHAVGIGATMTLPMDVRVVAERAKLGFVFSRRGIVPEACSTYFLPRLVGMGKALEWVSTGRLVRAEEALAAGLATRVVAGEKVLAEAVAIAREIAEHTSAISVGLARRMLWRGLGYQGPWQAHEAESRAMYLMGRSEDAREGVNSFLEKRPARFPMRVSEELEALVASVWPDGEDGPEDDG